MKTIFKSALATLALVSCLSLTSCNQVDWRDTDFKDNYKDVLVKEDDVVLEDSDFHTALQKAYILTSFGNNYDEFKFIVRGMEELSKPRGVKITQNDKSDKYVQLSLKEDFSDAFVYTLDDANEPYVKNLLGNTKYYYRTSDTKDKFNTPVNEITTENLFPRNLDVDGVSNVRDLGGYESSLGGHIKQGMYYRGARLTENNADTPKKLVTEKGYDVLVNTLKIKTEIDLRSDKKETSNMNNDVFKDIEYVHVPMTTYDVKNMLLEQKPSVKMAFDVLSNKANYPVYVHCKIGTDRTGLITFLLGALLGMNVEDLVTDYLFSNFGTVDGIRTYNIIQTKYYGVLKDTYTNVSSLSQAVEAYLLEIGNTQKQIDDIKSFMIEK